MRSIRFIAISVILTFFVAQLANAAGSDVSLGGRIVVLTPLGYLVIIGIPLAIIGLGIWIIIKKRRKLD